MPQSGEAIIRSHADNAMFAAELRELLASGQTVYIEYTTEKRRTNQQNSALHVFCRELSEVLNAHGVGLKAWVDVKERDVPFDPDLVKETIVRPLCNVLTGKHSTADALTTDYDRMHKMLSLRLPEMLGRAGFPGIVVPPWPSRFG